MKTQTLTPLERAEAYAVACAVERSPGYALAVRWISRAGLIPRQTWKTCSIDHVRGSMLASTGVAVGELQMAMALAATGFVAREIGGEPSTNVRLDSLPKRGIRVPLDEGH